MKPTRCSLRYSGGHLLCAALACATPALHATTFTWLGLGNTDNWEDNSGNWDGSVSNPYPGYLSVHDNVVLPAASQGYVIILSAILSIDGITVGAPYLLTVNGHLAIQQAISGSGLSAHVGSSLLFVSSASAGSTTITVDQFGILDFLNNATAATAAINSAGYVTFQNNATAPNASVSLSGGTLDVSGMAVPLTLGTLQDIAASPGTLTLGSTSLALQSAADQVFHGSVTGNSGALTQAGTGTLTLSGNNGTFAGGLNVQAGALQVDGDFSAAPTTVDGGATLRGSGRTGSLSLIDGTLVPGGGTGTSLRVASLACSDAQITFDLDAGTRLVIDGTLAVAQCPQMHITLTTTQPIASGESFDVATLSSGTDYVLADISVTPPAGYMARASIRANDVVVTLFDPSDEIFGGGFD